MYKITTPITDNDIKNLKAGDIVELSGEIFTARDAAHNIMAKLINDNKPLPFDIKGQIIYYTGATPTKQDEIFGSCGPTTSSRMDKYTPMLLNLGLKGIIGKGKRNDDVIQNIKKNKAIYFVAIGGAGAYYKSTVKNAEIVAFPELQSEAIYKLQISSFKVVVAIDSNGNSIFGGL